jgi:hypothetical protein
VYLQVQSIILIPQQRSEWNTNKRSLPHLLKQLKFVLDRKQELGEQKLNKTKALAILSSDALSSVAYGPEQILIASEDKIAKAFVLLSFCSPSSVDFNGLPIKNLLIVKINRAWRTKA